MSLVCYLHPASSAQDRCATCRRTICPGCVVARVARRERTRSTLILCRSCADRLAHQRRRLQITLIAVGSIVAAAALAVAAVVAG